MVFAIAALLIQVTPAIQPVMPTASSVAANSSAADDSTVIVKPTSDNTATVRLNPEPVKVALSDAKQKPTYALNPVSLESTQNAKSFDTIRIPEANGIKPEGIRSAYAHCPTQATRRIEWASINPTQAKVRLEWGTHRPTQGTGRI